MSNCYDGYMVNNNNNQCPVRKGLTLNEVNITLLFDKKDQKENKYYYID